MLGQLSPNRNHRSRKVAEGRWFSTASASSTGKRFPRLQAVPSIAKRVSQARSLSRAITGQSFGYPRPDLNLDPAHGADTCSTNHHFAACLEYAEYPYYSLAWFHPFSCNGYS